MPKERANSLDRGGKTSRLRRLVHRSRRVWTILSETFAQERQSEREQQAQPDFSAPEIAKAAAARSAAVASTDAEMKHPFGAPWRQSGAASEPDRPWREPALEPTPALQERFGSIEQRLTILSDRVELMGDRVQALRRKKHTATGDVSRMDAALERLVERVDSLEKTATLPPAAKGLSEGTLRPPKVPQGLELPIASAPVAKVPVSKVPEASLPARDAAKEPVQREQGISGFGERPTAHPRPGRKFAAGPLLSGNIAGLSLGSLFSLFEFERASGVLRICNDERRLELVLRGGSVVRCELDGTRTSASIAVREAFSWPLSTFSFERDVEEDDSEPPQSVNALMLEAMRFHDEELRTG